MMKKKDGADVFRPSHPSTGFFIHGTIHGSIHIATVNAIVDLWSGQWSKVMQRLWLLPLYLLYATDRMIGSESSAAADKADEVRHGCSRLGDLVKRAQACSGSS